MSFGRVDINRIGFRRIARMARNANYPSEGPNDLFNMSAVAEKNGTPKRTRETAETMAGKQKDIAVSEFFAKNRSLPGFATLRTALLNPRKVCVHNSLEACR